VAKRRKEAIRKKEREEKRPNRTVNPPESTYPSRRFLPRTASIRTEPRRHGGQWDGDGMVKLALLPYKSLQT
jgi:hypothetical protein